MVLLLHNLHLTSPLGWMHGDGECNINGVGSSCNATACDCGIEYQGNQCQSCNIGYYVSSGTDGTDPMCSSK